MLMERFSGLIDVKDTTIYPYPSRSFYLHKAANDEYFLSIKTKIFKPSRIVAKVSEFNWIYRVLLRCTDNIMHYFKGTSKTILILTLILIIYNINTRMSNHHMELTVLQYSSDPQAYTTTGFEHWYIFFKF